MNDTRDPDLTRLYREASAEAPPAALGQVLGTAAAAAVARQAPATPVSRIHRKWGAPLALAASVVLGLGIVLRVAVERPDMRPAAEAPAVAEAPAAPPSEAREQAVSKAASGNATSMAPQIAPVPDQAMQQRAQRKIEKREAFPAGEAVTAPGTTDAMRKSTAPAAAAEMAKPAGPEPAPAVASAPAPMPSRPQVESAAPGSLPTAPEPARMARDMDVAAQRIAPAARAALAERKADAASAEGARARIESGAAAPAVADATLRMIAEESTLTQAEWIKRIIDMRRAGRVAEADASLRRFILRHPGHAVPEAARGP